MDYSKPRGGKRPGAGRKPKYNEPTCVVRLPQTWAVHIKRLLEPHQHAFQTIDSNSIASLHWPSSDASRQLLTLYATRVAAGFPSPADDYIEGQLDLNEHLIQHPAATFYVRVSGDSMTGAGIYPGDILIVDRAVEATNGKIVIAVINGELTVKRLAITDGHVALRAENGAYPAIVITESMDFVIWGVVTGVVRRL